MKLRVSSRYRSDIIEEVWSLIRFSTGLHLADSCSKYEVDSDLGDFGLILTVSEPFLEIRGQISFEGGSM